MHLQAGGPNDAPDRRPYRRRRRADGRDRWRLDDE